jgi:hypothetical protein
MPYIGRNALNANGGDAYMAVDALIPAAASGDLQAQISIAYIMQGRLNGHFRGISNQPFTWRETWAWWKITAFRSDYMAGLLGGAYSGGLHGLPKNEKLGACLELGKINMSIHDRVQGCFMKYGSPSEVWK